MSGQQQNFEVALPAGGTLVLQTPEEVDFLQKTRDAYVTDYKLSKVNDLALVGAILSQHLLIFRAQQTLTGMEPQFDHAGVPTGLYTKIQNQKSQEVASAQKTIANSSSEIREMEKVLGIDKKTRESGGEYTVGQYVSDLKKHAHSFGVHITKRTKAYEEFVMELRWKCRVLRNADPEDRAYHDISEEKIIDWAISEMAKLEEIDKKFAKERGRLFVGKV